MANLDVSVVGSGIAGLATALRLSHAGRDVQVFESHARPGGKIRTLHASSGPVDAGPTVLTLRPVFEKLFKDVGERLSDHVTLLPQEKIARHFWADGTKLDLFSDRARNVQEVDRVFGSASAKDFENFDKKTRELFDAFEQPMMFSSRPNRLELNKLVMLRPKLVRAMAPHLSMAKSLALQFREPKLAQLFGRYATYVGGSPLKAPALLSLIWQAEASGVWQVEGGMHVLAEALHSLCQKRGVCFHFNTHVERLDINKGQIRGVETKQGEIHGSPVVVFNGDPAALADGYLGTEAKRAVKKTAAAPRSLSAYVWSFSAIPSRKDLGLHNVFFSDVPHSEFSDLAAGKTPRDPNIYICAQDRGNGADPNGPERFEIIINAPPTAEFKTPYGETERCTKLKLSALDRMGLTFSPEPETLTTPAMFNRMFPGSEGALYGRSPHGFSAALKRPHARTPITGLYLAGGGCHPGAGVPMATLSGQHAAEAILSDQTSTFRSRKTATRGGMSMGSRAMAPEPSRSSAS